MLLPKSCTAPTPTVKGVRARWLWALCSAASLSCGTKTDTVALGPLSIGGAASMGMEAGAGTAARAGSAVQCGDSYPRLAFAGASGGAVCAASFARGRMDQALCSCGDLGALGGILTDAFDSSTGLPAPGAAAVGVNGAYSSPATTLVGGSLTVAATTPLLLLSPLDVQRDLRLAGPLTVISTLTVARDAWFAESTNAPRLVVIGRNIHQVPGKMLGETVTPGANGQLITEAFSVAAPCRCDPQEVTNWSSAIASAAQQNDNASIGLSPSAFIEPVGAVATTLPCGRFYVNGISTTQPIQLTIVGRVALLVAGDVLTSGDLRVTLEPGAELDWFIGGRLDAEQALVLGDAARPAALRVYVAGAGDLSLRSPESIAANLYAPNADVQLDGKGGFSGSLFAHSISSTKPIGVRYDSAVQRIAESCTMDEAPASCGGCGQCADGKACVAGTCSACATDDDCCWPLVCNGGRCAAGP